MFSLSIVICTRNRPDDLERCIISIINSEFVGLFRFIEVLIIDDGELSEEVAGRIEHKLAYNGIKYSYIRKTENHGLFYSRYVGAQNSIGDIILYLDDDVEISKTYLTCLEETYRKNTKIIGLGGVDIQLKTTWYYRLYLRFFLLSARRIGNLSISGETYSCVRWPTYMKVFHTEYLTGFNMSYKKEILNNFPMVKWFDGYSLFEDIFLSYYTSRAGQLLINPYMKVNHNVSHIARDPGEQTKCTAIINQFYFLQYFHFPWWKYIFCFWSQLGIILLTVLRRKKYGSPAGYFLGLKKVFYMLIKGK